MTRLRTSEARAAVAFVSVALATVCAHAAQPASSPEQLGRALFVGQSPMQAGGPPCGSCHSISGLGFPNGGVMGPDLSGIYQTLGPDGTDAALQTLFFPTMIPIYDERPLTPAEQRALKAFLVQAGTTPVGRRDTLVLSAAALAGFVLLIAITWVARRGRLRGVRAPLVARAPAGGERP
jgi:ubiquinol-cytochrome c reductase cytochrome c subunit